MSVVVTEEKKQSSTEKRLLNQIKNYIKFSLIQSWSILSKVKHDYIEFRLYIQSTFIRVLKDIMVNFNHHKIYLRHIDHKKDQIKVILRKSYTHSLFDGVIKEFEDEEIRSGFVDKAMEEIWHLLDLE